MALCSESCLGTGASAACTGLELPALQVRSHVDFDASSVLLQTLAYAAPEVLMDKKCVCNGRCQISRTIAAVVMLCVAACNNVSRQP